MVQSTFVQECLDRLHNGDSSARDELISATCDRLRQLAHNMLGWYGRLRRWEQTDDVMQNAVLRLCRTLKEVSPASPKDFYRLATLQIRRELIDLSRRHFGPLGQGANHRSKLEQGSPDSGATPTLEEQGHLTCEPESLASWTEFHLRVDALPEEVREVFEVIWYQELSHADAAELFGVSTKTIQRRWQAACVQLYDLLEGHLPA